MGNDSRDGEGLASLRRRQYREEARATREDLVDYVKTDLGGDWLREPVREVVREAFHDLVEESLLEKLRAGFAEEIARQILGQLKGELDESARVFAAGLRKQIMSSYERALKNAIDELVARAEARVERAARQAVAPIVHQEAGRIIDRLEESLTAELEEEDSVLRQQIAASRRGGAPDEGSPPGTVRRIVDSAGTERSLGFLERLGRGAVDNPWALGIAGLLLVAALGYWQRDSIADRLGLGADATRENAPESADASRASELPASPTDRAWIAVMSPVEHRIRELQPDVAAEEASLEATGRCLLGDALDRKLPRLEMLKRQGDLDRLDLPPCALSGEREAVAHYFVLRAARRALESTEVDRSEDLVIDCPGQITPREREDALIASDSEPERASPELLATYARCAHYFPDYTLADRTEDYLLLGYLALREIGEKTADG